MTANEEGSEILMSSRRPVRLATIVVALIVLCLVIALWVQTSGMTYPSDVFPKVVFATIAVLACIILISAIIGGQAAYTTQPPVKRSERHQIIGMLAITVTYIALVDVLGFYVSTFLFLATSFTVPPFLGNNLRGKLQVVAAINLIAAVGVTAAVYCCFRLLLQVPTPKGEFF